MPYTQEKTERQQSPYGEEGKAQEKTFQETANQWKWEREAPVHAPPVKEANKGYDRKAKTRHFEVNDLVYLYCNT